MKNVFKKTKSEEIKKYKLTSAASNVLKALNLDNFNHETDFVNWVAENNANLFNVPIKTAYSKVNNYLIALDYYRKNWLSLYRRSKFGSNAFLIFAIESKLYFQLVNLSSRRYDITGKLIEATIFYEPYEKNSVEVILYETYKIIDKEVKIERSIYRMQNNKKEKQVKFKEYIINNKLTETQTLPINYLPIAPMRNKANEESDCTLAMSKIKMLDIFFEQIILDVVVNAPKFLFVNIYGNQQKQLEQAVKDLITKNYLFVQELKSVEILEGTFKGKQLTDVVDWIFNEISKRIFLYIPSQKKSAQQTQGEAEAVNIGTINAVEQKMLQYKIDTFNFLKILIDYDRDLLNNQTFSIKEEITNENLKIEMDFINPGTNQLESDYGTRKNNVS